MPLKAMTVTMLCKQHDLTPAARPASIHAAVARAPLSRRALFRTRRVSSLPEQITDADLLRIPVGPGAVHVERYGHGGPGIVLLHGFGTSSFVWRAIAPRLALAKHTAFAIDMLGYGESDRPFGEDFGIAAQAEHLDRAM